MVFMTGLEGSAFAVGKLALGLKVDAGVCEVNCLNDCMNRLL